MAKTGTDILQIASAAKKARASMAALSSEVKNNTLAEIADALIKSKSAIIKANELDIKLAEEKHLAQPLVNRLKLDEEKIRQLCDAITELIKLAEPVGRTLKTTELDEGLLLYKVSCPLGVVGVIFEARPDALVQISTLCLKSGNCVLLKGGSEALNTNRVLADIIRQAVIAAGIDEGWLALLETRTEVAEMLRMDGYIDLLIPRGSSEFVKYIMANTNIPVLGHAEGICHVYVDSGADIDMAVRITIDSKCQYCSACNAAETLLVHKNIADEFLPKVKKALEAQGVQLRGCAGTAGIIEVKPVSETDWRTEYLDYILSIKVVADIDEAIEHINRYGSGHTDSIVTQNKENAARFLAGVDSADVFVNCSTRFSDGFRFGLGAEVGISTNKIHARGPVGLEGLLTYKWLLIGDGHIVADYTGPNARKFTHREIQRTAFSGQRSVEIRRHENKDI